MSTKLSLSLSAAILAAFGVFSALCYPRLSATVPVHWGLNGEADQWLPKEAAGWTFAGIMAVFLVLFQVLPLISPDNFSVSRFLPTYNVIRVVLIGMFGYMSSVAMLAGMNPGYEAGPALIGGLMLFMAVLGNFLGKVRKNFWIGIRLPWTLASDKNWIATHRLAARLLVGAGIVGAIAVFAGTPLAVVSIGLMAVLLLPVLYSLWLFRTGRDVAAATLVLLLLAGPAFGAEKEVTFKGVGGLELRGTLAVPDNAMKGKTKAMLLIPGSGPTDRDGNQRPAVVTDLLKTIAGRLEKEGVATLRFDKRGTLGYAKSFPRDMEALGEFFSFETFIGDAEAGLEFLRAQPEVDPSRTGVLGHSEGTLIALKMSQGKNPPPYLLLMACPGRPLGDVLQNQLESKVIREGMSAEEREPLLKSLADSMVEFKTSGKIPASIPGPFKMYFPLYITKYLHASLFFDPLPLATAYPGPVLLLQGEKDIQVLASKDAGPLRKAFAGNSGFEYREFASLSHAFKLVKDENKEAGFEGELPAEVLKTIVDWMGRR